MGVQFQRPQHASSCFWGGGVLEVTVAAASILQNCRTVSILHRRNVLLHCIIPLYPHYYDTVLFSRNVLGILLNILVLLALLPIQVMIISNTRVVILAFFQHFPLISEEMQ